MELEGHACFRPPSCTIKFNCASVWLATSWYWTEATAACGSPGRGPRSPLHGDARLHNDRAL